VKRDIDLEIYFLNSFRFKLLVCQCKIFIHNIIIAIIEVTLHIKLYKLLVCH
jgi:hypothetical protein